MPRLGELLATDGGLTQNQLSSALLLQKKTGSRLGDVVIGAGYAGYKTVYEAVAKQHGMPFVDLIASPPDASLLLPNLAETYLRLHILPWRRDGERLVVAVCELSEPVVEWVRESFGEDTAFVITSPFDIRRAIEAHFGEVLERKSRLWLWTRHPESSARVTLPLRQRQIALGIGALSVLFIAWMPIEAAIAFIALCHILYTATMLFKCVVFRAGSRLPRNNPEAPPIEETSLPVYTVLVPMYKEASSLPGLLEALQRLDYPPSKLDIKLVLEGDDKETLAAAYALKPSYRFEIIRVPVSQPRTKPKACNYALRFARGQYVTIFDADDRPDPLQLKKAVQAFRSLPPDVVCLQARLNYYNANDNLLTRFFSLEYTILFHFMLYGLEQLDIPIPLGGTSNHIALDRLKAVGEWDPYNVTEDADLGIRLAARGLKTRMLDSYTMEESPNRLMPWIRQRSRWIKGYMQTWLVHMRNPGMLYSNLGPRGFAGFQCFVGLSSFSFLSAPIVLLLSALWMNSAAIPFPVWLTVFTLFNFGLYLISHWYLSVYCAVRYRKYRVRMIVAAACYPLYLLMHSIASYKALIQLILRPHFWEKTVHGLSRRIDALVFEQDVVKLR